MHTADVQFLINCGQKNLTENQILQLRQHLKQLSDTALWELAELAQAHTIYPLFYQAIQHHANDLFTSDLAHQFKLKNLQLLKQNLRMSAELVNIVSICQQHDMQVLAFKGPALAQMAYGNISLRQYNDLDIFVHREQLNQIARLLTQNQFQCSVDISYLSNQAFLDVKSDCLFMHKTQPILLEVHWTVFRDSYSSKMKNINLWQDTQTVALQNNHIATFKTEILLLYLCMHGSKHIWHRIEWIADVDRLIRSQNNINWDEIYTYAQTVNATTMLNLGLFLTTQLFSTPLPDSIQSRCCTNKQTIKLCNKVISMLMRQTHLKDSEIKNNYRHLLFHLALCNNRLQQFSLLCKNLMPITARDVQTINLPKQLYFLYYFFRPFRLINKYVHKLYHYLR